MMGLPFVIELLLPNAYILVIRLFAVLSSDAFNYAI